jgi:hypothetical protein
MGAFCCGFATLCFGEDGFLRAAAGFLTATFGLNSGKIISSRLFC